MIQPPLKQFPKACKLYKPPKLQSCFASNKNESDRSHFGWRCLQQLGLRLATTKVCAERAIHGDNSPNPTLAIVVMYGCTSSKTYPWSMVPLNSPNPRHRGCVWMHIFEDLAIDEAAAPQKY